MIRGSYAENPPAISVAEAVQLGWYSIVEEMVHDKGLSIDDLSNPCESPLWVAFREKQWYIFERLLEWGATPTITCNGKTLLMALAEAKQYSSWEYEHVALFLSKRVPSLLYNTYQGESVLMRHIRLRSHDLTELVLRAFYEQGVLLDFRDRKGRTALMHAVLSGSSRLVNYIIQLGAQVLAQDNQGRTACNYAHAQRKFEVLKFFIQYDEACLIALFEDAYLLSPPVE